MAPTIPTPFEESTGPRMSAQKLIDRLSGALLAEVRLLAELVAVMRRQRECVAIDDLEGVDESVFATHRILSTLGEARKRRRSIALLLGESDDLSLKALDNFFSGVAPENIRDAGRQLEHTALTLHREVEINRRVLRQSLDASDQHVRLLCGMPPGKASGYTDERSNVPPASTSAGGHIVDRRI